MRKTTDDLSLSVIVEKLLGQTLQPVNLAPPVRTAIQTLPLNELPWQHFELLCVRLALKEQSCIDARMFGTPGQDQEGIDLYAVNEQGQYSVWQCKRYQRFQPPLTLSAVETFLAGNWAASATQFRLCVTDDLTSTDHAYAIESARKLLQAKRIQFIPMGMRELSSALKLHPDLVSDFFGHAWSESFCAKQIDRGAATYKIEGEPDSVDEVLISNLMQVVTHPNTVWSARTDKRKHREVYAIVSSPDAFIFQHDRLYTFANLREKNCPLRQVVDVAQITNEPVASWSIDSVKTLWFTELLNSCLMMHLYRLGLKWTKGHRYFFRPNRDGGNRLLGEGKRVLKLAYKVDGFWVHRSATIQFKKLGQRFFLLLEPGFTFTNDGLQLIGGTDATKKSMQWGGRQQNDDILRSMLFWTSILSERGKEARIHAGPEAIILRTLPATAKMSWGIAHDHIHMSSLMEATDIDAEDVEHMIRSLDCNIEQDEEEGGDDETDDDEE